MKISDKVLPALFEEGEYSELATAFNSDGAVTASGLVNGVQAYAFCQNGGAFNASQCKKIINLYELAVKTGSPIFGIYSSDGVDLGEGFEALNEYSALLRQAFTVSGVVPQISVIAGDCLGVASIISNTADIVIGVKECDYYCASNDEGKTDGSSENGVVDILCESLEEAVSTARKASALLPQNNLSPLPEFDYSEPVFSGEFISSVCDEGSALELKAEYAKNVNTVLATICGSTVGIIEFKGSALCTKCSYKSESFIKLCDAYNIPIITVANSEGFKADGGPQLITALTKLASAYSNTTCPKISVITEQSIGGAYVLLAGKGANADVTLAWNTAIATPLPISSAVAFMYSGRLAAGESREALENEYKATLGSVNTAAECGIIDDVFTPEQTREKLVNILNMLSSKREATLPRKHTVK